MAEWIAYAGLEPFGQFVDDFRAGQVCATLANIHRAPDNEKGFSAADFMPSLRQPARDEVVAERPEQIQDPEAHSRLLMATLFGKTEENHEHAK